MAESYSGWNQKYYSWGSAKTRCYVSATVENISDTQCRVNVSGAVQCDSAYNLADYGCAVQCGTGNASNTSRFVFDGGSGWHWVSTSGVYNRSSSAYSVKARSSYWGETVSGYGGCSNSGSTEVSVTIPAIPVYKPNAITDAAATRNGDSKNSLSWKNHVDTTHPYSGIYVDRQIDGGEWSNIDDIGGGSTSFIDASTSANHGYRYRVIPHNGAGNAGAHCYTETLYNTPCAPGKPVASRSEGNTVLLKLENGANTATSLEMQRTSDISDESAYVTLAALQGTVTDATDDPGGGTFYYRARNARGDLKSSWSAWSEPVVTICPPAAPVLVSPSSGTTLAMSQQFVEFHFRHYALDGSAQTEAEVQYSNDGGSTWAAVSISGDAQEASVENGFALNSTVTWRARTKGADPEWGPWSATRVFYVKQVPTAVFASPQYGFTVENTPIHIALDYMDDSGSLANARLAILKDGATVYERDMGTDVECDIYAADFLPENGASYRLAATVRSTSTLAASAVREVSVDFIPPACGIVLADVDVETGYVNLTVDVERVGDKAEASSFSLYRVTDYGRMMLGEGLRPGQTIVDRHAPVNVEYEYEAATFADSGAYSTARFPGVLESPRFYFYFGDGRIASAEWDPEQTIEVSHPSRELVRYANRMYPVLYDTIHIDESMPLDAVILSKEDAMDFYDLIRDGRCVFKSADGFVFHAAVDGSLRPDNEASDCYGYVSVSIVRIDGGAL